MLLLGVLQSSKTSRNSAKCQEECYVHYSYHTSNQSLIKVCHMKSNNQRCMLVCDIGYAGGGRPLFCRTDADGNRVWRTLFKGHVCEETVVITMGGNQTPNLVQMISLSETRQLPDFYESTDTFTKRGTVQFNLKLEQLQHYTTSGDNCLTIAYKFEGPSSSSVVESAKSTSHVHTSVKMDKIYLLSEQETGVVVQQIEMKDEAKNIQIARDFLTIDIGDGLTGNLGCTARFSETSFLYISGTRAAEVNIVSRDYKILPGEMNLERKSPGCDVIEIDGMMTTLVGGGEGTKARKTSEYYDKKSKMWKFTNGNFSNSRYYFIIKSTR